MEIRTFTNCDFGIVEATILNNQVYFTVSSVTKLLRYSMLEDYIKYLTLDGVTIKVVEDTILLNEDGFYTAALHSKLPHVEEVEGWVGSIALEMRNPVETLVDQISTTLDNLKLLVEQLKGGKDDRKI